MLQVLRTSRMASVAAEPIVVTVQQDLQDLVPLFLAQRKADQAAIAQALPLRDFEALRRTGHGIAGAGGSYGFDHLTVVGERLIQAARAHDAVAIASLKREFDDYLERLIVKYV